jgi:hypothetical protein
MLSKGYCLCLKLLNSHALPLSRYPIKPLGSITYLLEVYYTILTKPRRQAIPTSFCDNIINHEIKTVFKNIYSMLTIWCQNILIQGNEVFQSYSHWCYKVHLNKVMELKCNTYIISKYFHSPWNLEGYCMALPKPISNTILVPCCDNILNHGTNESISITHQNLIEIPLYHQCDQYCNTFMYVYH